MYRHQWAMSHCREKAEHLLLNIQHAPPEQGMSQAAQYQAHCERRAAYARRCCSKAPHNFRPSAGAGGRKRARCAARVGGGGQAVCSYPPPSYLWRVFSFVLLPMKCGIAPQRHPMVPPSRALMCGHHCEISRKPAIFLAVVLSSCLASWGLPCPRLLLVIRVSPQKPVILIVVAFFQRSARRELPPKYPALSAEK